MSILLTILIFITIVLIVSVIIKLLQIHTFLKILRKSPEEKSGNENFVEEEPVVAEKGKNPAFAFGTVILAISAFYTFFATSIPQVEFHPPKNVEISSDLSDKEHASLGKVIFEGKGTCLLCHTINGDGLRAPDLAGIGERAGKRVNGYSSEDYLLESLLNPAKYIVEGYAPSMPIANKPPAMLSQKEIVAVIAYLQSMGGEISVSAGSKPNFEKIGYTP